MSLEKYQNQELKGIINSVQVKEGKAKESGNPYTYIELTFINGYKKRLFLNNEELFAWTNAIEILDTHKDLDEAF